MKESTLARITASTTVARRMAQKALAVSPNPEWTEYEIRLLMSGSRVRERSLIVPRPSAGRWRSG